MMRIKQCRASWLKTVSSKYEYDTTVNSMPHWHYISHASQINSTLFDTNLKHCNLPLVVLLALFFMLWLPASWITTHYDTHTKSVSFTSHARMCLDYVINWEVFREKEITNKLIEGFHSIGNCITRN